MRFTVTASSLALVALLGVHLAAASPMPQTDVDDSTTTPSTTNTEVRSTSDTATTGETGASASLDQASTGTTHGMPSVEQARSALSVIGMVPGMSVYTDPLNKLLDAVSPKEEPAKEVEEVKASQADVKKSLSTGAEAEVNLSRKGAADETTIADEHIQSETRADRYGTGAFDDEDIGPGFNEIDRRKYSSPQTERESLTDPENRYVDMDTNSSFDSVPTMGTGRASSSTTQSLDEAEERSDVPKTESPRVATTTKIESSAGEGSTPEGKAPAAPTTKKSTATSVDPEDTIA
ncbi:hypothetical protein IWQ60_008725 [Tieghemiomyces parasiticus]|uniref:Uncharacterized protein n=1 Tax=Tieghemiomyces parasiticus TaxID=78921 RepID=A0A9W7ZQT4_9FUNG|nr:hypothetical protein IWQ60_008725 [Tieghemiomyces parasiticus]